MSEDTTEKHAIPEYSANPGATSTAHHFNNSVDVERNDAVPPPPSYDSLYGRVKQAKEESDGNVDFFTTALRLLFASLACTIITSLLLAIPVAEIVIGAIYMNDCPAERYIPIYLVVSGSFGVFKGLFSIAQQMWQQKKQKNMTEEQKKEEKSTNPVDAVINLFLFGWFIAGNVWIYGTKGEWVSEPSTAENYCHPTVYYFAYWILTASYILLLLMCLLCIITCICVLCFSKKD